ncbi:MAG TPA: AI-2E family transporter [Acidimicrobiales bacterium]|nr:AI-2E family transporter [Acidimicrobiales bacterium]
MTPSQSSAGSPGNDRPEPLARPAPPLTEPAGPLGRRGRPFDRRSPYFLGLGATFGVATAAAVIWAFYAARHLELSIVLAFFIAVGLDPIVGFLARRMPRWAAVLLVGLGAVVAFASFLAFSIPPLEKQLTQFVHHLPTYLSNIRKHNGLLGRLDAQYHIIDNLKKKISSSSGGINIAGGLLGAGKAVLSLTATVILVLVLTIYFLSSMPRIKTTMWRLAPASRRPRVQVLGEEVFSRVGGFVLGNIATSVIAGAGTLVWLTIFGVPYPVLLSVFVALMDLVPIVGSTIGGIIVSLVALTVSLPVALATAGFYIFYRLAEDYIITPRVMRRTVEVSGVVTVVAVILGGGLLGIVGALIAIPVAAAIQLVFREVASPSLEEM